MRLSASSSAAPGALYTLSLLLPSVMGLALEGYGKEYYYFRCGAICQYIAPRAVECPEYAGMTEEQRAEASPSPACLGNNANYLTTIAWCIKQHCPEDTPRWKIEQYWEVSMIHDYGKPALGYIEALAMVNPKEPPKPLGPGELVLNRTITLPEASYIAVENGLRGYTVQEKNTSTYSLVVFLTCVLIPIAASFLRFLPIPESVTRKVNAYLIDPPAWGRKHLVPTLGLGLVPTRGQALFILYIIAVNCGVCFGGYPNWTPNGVFPDEHYRLMRLIGNRTGIIAFANLPLVILFAGRNSLLLHVTNWSHSTFLLLHRWIGAICIIQVCLHSLLWLQIMIERHDYAEALAQPYWIWGIVGTVFFSALIPFSALPIRKVMYEVFIIAHIVLTVISLVGSWYHIWFLYEFDGGFEIWLILAMVLWVFERLVRIGRFAKHGVKHAYITRIDDKYLRVDIPDVDAEGHCFAYFPTVSWRVWENHPFSVVTYSNGGSACDNGKPGSKSSSQIQFEAKDPLTTTEGVTSKEVSAENSATQSITSRTERSRPGITLFIQHRKGLTAKLAKKADSGKPIPVLIECSYGHKASSFKPTAEYPNTLVIAGGVGIAGVLSALQGSLSMFAAPAGTTKLYWGLKQPGLANTVKSILVGEEINEAAEGNGQVSQWGHIEARVTVGSRMDIKQVVTSEVESATGGTTVIVCGPNGMCDDVRYVCAALARHGAKVRYIEEAFSW